MNICFSWRNWVIAAAVCLALVGMPAPDLGAQGSAPAAPALLTPLDGTRTTGVTDPPLGVPTLVWEPVVGATRYQVQISASSGFAATVVDVTVDNPRYTPVLALGDGIFYWRVRAAEGNNWGPYAAPFSFQVDWGDNGAIHPILLQPEDGATRAVFGHEDFAWTAVPGAAAYRFEIATDPTLANIVYSVKTPTPHHTPLLRLARNIFYWRVTPIDYRDHAGVASPVWSFTFNWDRAPELLAPADEAELAFVPRFSWTAVEGTKEYRLCISTQENGSDCAPIVTRNTDHTPTTAFSNDQDYFWMVQAVDGQGVTSPWSELRRFRARWYFKPQLLSPANNSIRLAYPFFSWAPVPGAERYQIQIASNNVFQNPIIGDETLYNVTNYTQPEWREAALDTAYYWRVRAINAQGSFGPWSDTWSFQFASVTAPNLVYPLPYYTPDLVNTPVHGDRSFGAPLFVWDTAHSVTFNPFLPVTPDFYRLEVDDDPAFLSPNFAVDTAGIAAAPTLAHPFANLLEGVPYHWRVRAYRNGVQLPQEGVQVIWTSRYATTAAPLPRMFTATAEPIYPDDGFEAVQTPPVLGWRPVAGATLYRVQVARDAAFTTIIDEALATHLNYVPWQGRLDAMPYGSYWWRLRGEDSANTPVGDWSAPRRFNLSVDLAIGNHYDFQAPATLAADASGRARVASSPDDGQGIYELHDLYAIVDRRAAKNYNQHWVVAFTTGATLADTVRYALYLDTDHALNSGGATDPLGNAITADPYVRPEYVVNVDLTGGVGVSALFYEWNSQEGLWNPGVTLESFGGAIEFDAALQAVQMFIPYTALGSANADWVGSLALALFSLEGSVVRDSVPRQGALLDSPVFVSNMLLPLYPFDTPMSNPIVHYDMPVLRWRMPAYGTDGYQVQVARDPLFTDIVETWESYETREDPFFTLIPSVFQSGRAYANNESYYWRVRTRHEKYRPFSSSYDYGPWSPAMRFKLDSRSAGNPQLSTGVDAFMTPTFTWERVEGASGYTIQIDDDGNFSSPLVNQKTDANSYTPLDTSSSLQPGAQYFWRVVMRRSNNIVGHWAPALSFTKTSLAPTPVGPLTGAVLDRQPTLRWNAVLTPALQPRLAAPTYRVQVDNNPAFTLPKINVTTQATSLTPTAGQSLADGVWYWRVALLDANNRVGPYSPVQSFTKEYPLPQLLWPGAGDLVDTAPTFRWAPALGAAYYRLQYADNSNYNGVTTVTTDLTEHTPAKRMATKTYYWRVQMYDVDRNPGPLIEGEFVIGSRIYLPIIESQ
jgi:hypothetical protein